MATSRKKIMVVDNHPLILHFVVDFLEKQGHEVVPAEDALAALHLLRDRQPEIIFIDLIMPKISGEQFCRIIRSKPEFQDIYLIILSAIAAEEQTAIAAFGADACIAKGPLAGMAAHLAEVLQQIDAGTLRQKETQVLGLDGIYQRQITRELLSAKCHFEHILGHIAEGILEVTDREEVIYANLIAQKLLGHPEEELLAGGLCDLFPEEQRERLAAIFKEQLDAGRCETIPAIPYGEKFLDLTLLPMADDHARSTLVVIRDITTSLRMENALHESEKKYRLLFQEMTNGFIFFEIALDAAGKAYDYLFLEVNAAFETLTGLSSATVAGKSIKEVFPDDYVGLMEQFNSVGLGQHGRFSNFCTACNRYFEFTFFHSEKRRLAVVLSDINDRKLLEEQLHEASITDELTGLLNRRGFITLAEQQLKIAARGDNPLFLLFADFDDLKRVNDEQGHQAGDLALAATAAIFRKTFRASDIIGRLGGDEFAILLTGSAAAADTEQAVLARLEENVSRESRQHHGQGLSLSCGMARFDPQAPCTLDELISRADRQMYHLKRRKKKK